MGLRLGSAIDAAGDRRAQALGMPCPKNPTNSEPRIQGSTRRQPHHEEKSAMSRIKTLTTMPLRVAGVMAATAAL